MSELQAYNPWPLLFKKTWDFKFEGSLKEKTISSLKEADRFITRQGIGTPEREGGVTSAVLDCSPTTPMPHQWPEFEQFGKFVLKTAKEICGKWCLNKAAQMACAKSWCNVHPQGGYTSEHNHHGVLIAVAAYLDVPPNSGNLLVKNPLNYHKFSEPLNPGYWSDPGVQDGLEWTPINVNTNDVLFFPGWLLHKTQRNASTENRFVMSWNISYTSNLELMIQTGMTGPGRGIDSNKGLVFKDVKHL